MGFDLFQSLNATGTPLTAIETFKPLVVNRTQENEESFNNSINKESFDKIDDLFKNIKSASEKNKLTKDFITSFAIIFEGRKESSHFSHQRKFLQTAFTSKLENNYSTQKEFLSLLGNYADFYKKVWIDYKGKASKPLEAISNYDNFDEKNISSLLILYLKSANHKMATTVLGSFYKRTIERPGEKNKEIGNLIQAIKCISAFYTIWRSARSNSGLDTVYRDFFKGNSKKEIPPRRWLDKKDLEIDDLKNYLKYQLDEKNLLDKDNWISKSKERLRYTNAKVVCKFLLFLSAHDTIPDPDNPGLMKNSKTNSNPFLRIDKWISDDLSTIEHISPQDSKKGWDPNLYDDNELFDSIGNLTLLPTDINISASNKGFQEKLVYYKYLSEKDPDKLEQEARNNNIDLKDKVVDKLRNAKHHSQISPIVEAKEGVWDYKMVNNRTDRILELSWDRIRKWLD
ncbi:MAG: DUF1524 domain-containing protein [Flavobacteriales bacterium]